MNKTIAIVEDDPSIAAVILRTLEEHGYLTEHYSSGSSFLTALRKKAPCLCLLDLGLPDIDGIGLLGSIKEIASIPVIILSGRHHPSDRIVGLELGADDYVVKPFDPREVVARIRTVLRRFDAATLAPDMQNSVATFSGWLFDPSALELTAPDGSATDLSSAEARLLQAFLEAPQRVLSRDFLLTKAGGQECFDRSIDVRMSRLRKKLQKGENIKGLIRTVYGAGYLLSCAVEWQSA
ncbi:MAG: response regulator transcription factor [Magnetovibrio sp.]|nr:response regulator transcription factor [Magnetovibrio sp.]